MRAFSNTRNNSHMEKTELVYLKQITGLTLQHGISANGSKY